MVEVELDPQHARLEHAQRLEEELLAGLVAVQHGDRAGLGHHADHMRGRGPEPVCAILVFA